MKCPSCNGLVGTGASRFMPDMSGSTMWDDCPNCGPVTPLAGKGRVTTSIKLLTTMKTLHPRRLYTDAEEQTIAAAYERGTPSTKLAAEWGTNRQTIKNVLIRNGVSMRKRWEAPKATAPGYDRYANVRAAQKARWAAYRAMPPWKRTFTRSLKRLRKFIAA